MQRGTLAAREVRSLVTSRWRNGGRLCEAATPSVLTAVSWLHLHSISRWSQREHCHSTQTTSINSPSRARAHRSTRQPRAASRREPRSRCAAALARHAFHSARLGMACEVIVLTSIIGDHDTLRQPTADTSALSGCFFAFVDEGFARRFARRDAREVRFVSL